MASPTFVQSQTSSTTDGTSHSVALPSATVGNLLLAMIAVDQVPTVSIDTGASGSNWTLSSSASNGSIVSGYFAYKIAEGSDVLTITTSDTQRISAVVFEFSGASGTVDGTSSNGSSTNSNPPSHSPAGGSKDYTWVAYRAGDATVQATVSPSGYSTLVSVSGGSGAGTTSGAAYLASTASSEDPGTFTSSSEQWVCWTIAVYPTANITSNLPSPTQITVAGNAPTSTVTAHITSNLPSPVNISVVGYAPTSTITTGSNITSDLPTPINISIIGNAPTSTITEHVLSNLPAPVNIAITGNTPTSTITEHIVSQLPTPVNISVVGNAPTSTITDHIQSNLPAPVAISLLGIAPTSTVSGGPVVVTRNRSLMGVGV